MTRERKWRYSANKTPLNQAESEALIPGRFRGQMEEGQNEEDKIKTNDEEFSAYGETTAYRSTRAIMNYCAATRAFSGDTDS